MVRKVINAFTIQTASILLLVSVISTTAEQSGSSAGATCQAAGPFVRVPELPEASGVAASKRSPGRFWAHNDSGDPVLIARDSNGRVLGRLRVTGAKVNDWEAVAVGPCPAGTCVYVGDIGDNDAERPQITIYRFPEPADTSGSSETAEVLTARYPDGAHDAEALLVTPKGDILIVTKGDTGPVALYRLPSGTKPGASAMLQSIGKPRDSGKTGGDRITDGAVSPSGTWIALRTTRAIVIYRAEDLISGNWRERRRVSLKQFGEAQGEGITFGDETTLYLVGEGGGKSQPGTFGRLTCTL